MLGLKNIFGFEKQKDEGLAVFEAILKKRFDKSINHNLPLLREYITFAADNNKNVDIQINDARNDRTANFLALKRIIEHADKVIRVFTRDLDKTALSQPQIRRRLSAWLNEQKGRKIYILLKDQNHDYKNSYFYERLLIETDTSQVEINYANEGLVTYQYNVIANDSGSFKIKEIEESGAEKVVVNYNDIETANSILNDLKSIFDETLAREKSSNVTECSISNNIVHLKAFLSNRINSTREDIERVIPENYSPHNKLMYG